MGELRRMVTNLYDDDKACVRRIIQGINDLQTENSRLKAEIAGLKKEE